MTQTRPGATDPVALTADLIRCPSVTPDAAGPIALLADRLGAAGFACHQVDRGGVPNLFARWGAKGHPRSFGFNGHVDVVPPGDPAAWSADPFGAEIRGTRMLGRGAVDMKSGVAAFVAAAIDFVRDTPPDGAVILTITGDEEGEALHGTTAILDWMASEGEAMSVCLVGEPTCPETFGEMMKIGRRGSMTAWFSATGKQGHAAYPHRAKNPVPVLARLVARLDAAVLDEGTAHFDPSTLVVTTFDTGNPATNVIPGACRATVNIRFNDAHTPESLTDWLRAEAAAAAEGTGIAIDMKVTVSGDSFLTPPGPLTDLVARAVTAETGLTPAFSTSGGTSDARFVKTHCPVVEFGLVGSSMHQVDEFVEVDQIPRLKAVYRRVLADYFA